MMLTAFQNFLHNCAISFDLPILDWIQANLQSGFMDQFMPFITKFGDHGTFWAKKPPFLSLQCCRLSSCAARLF